MKNRLDQELLSRGLVTTRSQAGSYIRLGKVTVNREVITKAGHMVGRSDEVTLAVTEQYVSRAALKLASVAPDFGLDFKEKVVLDVGSSTGGFTEYALKQGARKVIAVDVGTDQMHASLRNDPRVELHEKTDIRDISELSDLPDIVVADVSFISLKEILPSVLCLIGDATLVVAMVKPQFEAGDSAKHKGVIKNDRMRRDILKDFEAWAGERFMILDKADSEVSGAKGNLERFYLLKKSVKKY